MRAPWRSVAPEVVDKLVTIAQDIPDCAVLDGPTPKRVVDKGSTFAVGVGEAAITSSRQRMEGLAIRYLETTQITCTVWSWSGGTELKRHRYRCEEILDALDTKLRTDVTLDGICDQVGFGPDFIWVPQVDSKGASYAVGFTVEVKATI